MLWCLVGCLDVSRGAGHACSFNTPGGNGAMMIGWLVG